MKVCLLCFKSTEKSGDGMDVYAWNMFLTQRLGHNLLLFVMIGKAILNGFLRNLSYLSMR